MSLLKMKFKLPKLLLRSMRKRKPVCKETNNAHCSNGKKWLKTKNFLSKHIGSVFSQAFRTNNKSQEILNASQKGNPDRIDLAMKEGMQMVGHLRIAPDDQGILDRLEKHFGERSLRRFSTHAGKQETSKHLARIPSKRFISHKGRHAKFTLKKAMQLSDQESESEEEEECRGIELCKKKILMGEKCRPLNKSGTLEYDENGFLLPGEP